MLPRALASRAKTIVLHPADTSQAFNGPLKLTWIFADGIWRSVASSLPRGDSWTPSWRTPRSRTRCALSYWPIRWPSWWLLASRARPWPPPWRCPRTPCRRIPGPAPCAWWSFPWPPPTRPGRTLERHTQRLNATYSHPKIKKRSKRLILLLSAALKYSGLTDA